MNTKFVFFFLIVTCLAQNFEARRTVISPRSINEINKNIEEVIKDIENALYKLIIQLPDILSNLENKIENIINSVHLAIENKVDVILKKINVEPGIAYKCVDKEESALKQLEEALANCKKDASNEICELNNATEELKNKARKLIDDNVQTVKQCIHENGKNLIQVDKCLKEHLNVIKTDAAHLIEQIMNSIKVAQEKSNQVSVKLEKCIAVVEGVAISKQKVIINEFTKCVEDHKQEQ